MNALDVYSHIKKFIDESKKRPHMYGGSPEGMYAMWWAMDYVALYIFQCKNEYSMDKYGIDVKKTAAMNCITYIRLEEGLSDDMAAFKRIVEWRNEYEEWRNNMIVKEKPELKSIL